MPPEKHIIMQWTKPEPATEEEIALAEKLEPGDYEVYSEKLNMIVTEGKEVFVRVGISRQIAAGDLICGLYTAQGDLVTAFFGTFLHAATAQLPIKYIMNNYYNNPTVGVKEGDVFYTNESTYGGIHNPDQMAVMPIFYKGQLIAWSAAAVHEPETGATEPGGMPPNAPTCYYEGMHLPPIKIAENFQIKDDIMEMMLTFISRAPRMQAVDVRARIAGCDRIRIRVEELAEQKGTDFVRGLFRKMLMVAEEGARGRIARWNDGVYRAVVFPSILGSNKALTRICMALKKEGDQITLDFTGTSPENDTSWNAFPWSVLAHTAVYLYSYIFYDLPISCGATNPINLIIPEGTMLNADSRAAVCCCVFLCKAMFYLSPLCFSKLIFSDEEYREICVAPNGSPSATSSTGINQWGIRFSDNISTLTQNTAGQGARSHSDGVNSGLFSHCFVSHAPDAEEDEVHIPVITLFRKHRVDAFGHGKYRGGCGTEAGYLMPYHATYIGFKRGDHMGPVPYIQGLFGGYPPAIAPEVVISQSNVLELMAKGAKDIPMSEKEALLNRRIEGNYDIVSGSDPTSRKIDTTTLYIAANSGGSGYGDVLERDPQAIVDDIKAGLLSEWSANNVYHVVYDLTNWTADVYETEKVRSKEKEKRKKRGIPYHEFVKEWSKKKPPEEMLRYYGSWPDAEKVSEIVRI
jgi:N-methylhydantoinase B/oxoprolinase/acetone carboxylase alpha subunit